MNVVELMTKEAMGMEPAEATPADHLREALVILNQCQEIEDSHGKAYWLDQDQLSEAKSLIGITIEMLKGDDEMKESKATKTWCVYHLIHVNTPYRYIPKLVIEEVPADVDLDHEILERAGYQYGEFNVPWANHVLEEVDVETSPSDLIARLRRGPSCENITYKELVERAEEPI